MCFSLLPFLLFASLTHLIFCHYLTCFFLLLCKKKIVCSINNGLCGLPGNGDHRLLNDKVAHALLEHEGGALGERHRALATELLLIGLAVVAQVVRRVLADDAQIHVAATAEIVEDARPDGVVHELLCLLLRHIVLETRLQHGHGRERTRTHRHERQAVRATVRRDGAEERSVYVDAAQHERRGDVALVLVEVLLEHAHDAAYAALLARVDAVQRQTRRDHARDHLRVGGSASTTAADVRGHVVDLLAVLVRDHVTVRGARVGTQHDAAVEHTPDDGRARLGGLGHFEAAAAAREMHVAGRVLEVEAEVLSGDALCVQRQGHGGRGGLLLGGIGSDESERVPTHHSLIIYLFLCFFNKVQKL
eukprot:PhM_4_TR17590/c0_g4_i1/m.83131